MHRKNVLGNINSNDDNAQQGVKVRRQPFAQVAGR